MNAVILKLTTSRGVTVVARSAGPGSVVLTLDTSILSLDGYLSPSEAESVGQVLIECAQEARKKP